MSYTRVRQALGATKTTYNYPNDRGGRYAFDSSGVCRDRYSTSHESVASFNCGEKLTTGTAAAATSSKPGFFENLWGGIKSAAQTRAGSQQPMVVSGGTPGWVMPVAIGGLVLGAVLLLTRKKAPTSNPARRASKNKKRRKRPYSLPWRDSHPGPVATYRLSKASKKWVWVKVK